MLVDVASCMEGAGDMAAYGLIFRRVLLNAGAYSGGIQLVDRPGSPTHRVGGNELRTFMGRPIEIINKEFCYEAI